MPNWEEVSNGVSQGPVLGQVLFNIFNNVLETRIECLPGKFTDGTKMDGLALDSLEKWFEKNWMKLSKYKFKVWHLQSNNKMHNYNSGNGCTIGSGVHKSL